MTDKETARYIPALGYSWLTAVYDPVVRVTTRESIFKLALLQQANLQPRQRVLDLACGTATLTIAAKLNQPLADITGIDGDSAILRIARDKSIKAGVDIHLDRGLSSALPYADASFDVVLCSLFFHHISRKEKFATFTELRRVLKPDGVLNVADWGKPQNAFMRFAFLGIQLLDGFPSTRDNVRGLLPLFMQESGFSDVVRTRNIATLFGTMSLYRACATA